MLVIDDEDAVRTVCQRLVQSMGHECDIAADADDAIAALSEHRYDLVLCDYRLASAQADDVVEAIAAIDPWQVRQVVIATGAAGDDGVRKLAERYGLELLPKPYGAEELGQLLGMPEAA
ncbi:MAG: response regulator [Dehalococcoidia bacterium]|nr:response regulator [Dehalococcoidia bacterium]